MYTPPPDKVLHVVAGALATLPGLLFGWQWAVASCAAAAVGRELYNLHHGGKFDLADIAATLAGGALMLLSAWLGSHPIF